MSYSPPSRSRSRSSSNHEYSDSLYPISNSKSSNYKSSSSHEFKLSPKASSKSSSKLSPKASSSSHKSKASNPETDPSFQNIELKMPEELPDKLNYNEKIAKKMDKIFQLHEKVEPFIGSFFLTNLFYLYLFNKYKMNCRSTNADTSYMMGISITISNSIDPVLAQTQNEEIESYADQMYDCIARGEKIMIMPFTYSIIIRKNVVGSHANLLIYREKTGELEHFEPHGAVYSGVGGDFVGKNVGAFLKKLVHLLNNRIKIVNKKNKHDFFRKKLKTVTLVKACDVCPVIEGVQLLEGDSRIPKNALIEPGGYCAAWSMFFAELCLKNPEISSNQVYKAIMDKTELYEQKNDYLRNVIRGYTCFINNKIAKHFSHVFGEPMSSAKAHHIDALTRTEALKGVVSSAEVSDYFEKMLEIMEVETPEHYYQKLQDRPEVKDRYSEFTRGIRRSTSSSSYKDNPSNSPPRRNSTSKSLQDKGVGLQSKGKKTQRAKKPKGQKNEERNNIYNLITT
jgi:hypothetical protein